MQSHMSGEAQELHYTWACGDENLSNLVSPHCGTKLFHGVALSQVPTPDTTSGGTGL